MHFSIPDTQEQYADGRGGSPTYTVYNIYINGNYHCCLRYKQLHALHEQLRSRCTDAALPPFPSKRLLPLSNSQLEARRAALEHYLQIIGQDARIARLSYLQQFLQRAQLDTALAECTISGEDEQQQLQVEVYSGGADGAQLLVNCHVQQNASALLQCVCRILKLPDDLIQFFCLYLMRKVNANDDDAGTSNSMPTSNSSPDEPATVLLLRRLMDFESPFITRLHAQPCQLLLRTCYWNARWDAKLLGNGVALKLLYHQTLADVAREWVICTPEMRRQLYGLQLQSRPVQYLELVRQLPSYGCLQFGAAQVDYPDAETTALVTIGNRELSLRTARGAKIYETKFRVTRMRCWRVSAMHNTFESRDQPTQLQLSFEYLMSKQTLRWITITSEQAMLMSVSLQAMVDELLHNDNNCSSSSGTGGSDDEQEASTSRAASESTSSTPSSASSCTFTSTSTTATASQAAAAATTAAATPPVKFLAERSRQHHKLTTARTFAAVFFRNDANAAAVRNEAFEEIGDDDL
ncbi:sorting nexin-17 [Drosophila grimshawi]|uniref:GH10647 n=1 Tax=Drosophila grimshawi TaxID=7222 RepID=B4JCK1_DROGR|nr:sorting nexin-17 [Drosophila grimshawi]EDW03155.1 GH10647 [Drosophila grimshawi]